MEVLFTLTKTIDGRVSNWRFVKVDDGYCAIGGNYKLLQYRNQVDSESQEVVPGEGLCPGLLTPPPSGGLFFFLNRGHPAPHLWLG